MSVHHYPPQPVKNHFLENGKSDMSPSPSTRWCPTPEQLMILEELYKRGLRTPSASQIQKITAHLAYYGKIQGKNVFYWFQNHKARDRQKLRKKLHQQHLLQQHLDAQFTAPRLPHDNPFLAPPHFQFQLSSSLYPPADFSAQVNTVCEEAPESAMMKQTWRTDLPKDCLLGSYGHDSTIIMDFDVGPTSPCCRSRTRPLETLELFPLTPHQKTTS